MKYKVTLGYRDYFFDNGADALSFAETAVVHAEVEEDGEGKPRKRYTTITIEEE